MKKEYCGLFGVYGNNEASALTFLGLYSLQHRGEESCGITSFDGSEFHVHKGMGLVGDVFAHDDVKRLRGYQAIGHVRYSTTGSSVERNIQPLFVNSHQGSLSLAHNGNLVNSQQLKDYLEKQGTIFYTTSDSEVILHLMMRSKKHSLVDKLTYALQKVKGAYSLLIMDDTCIAGVRDPLGFRPLCIGRINDSFCFSSESCALDLVGAEFVREVLPGEIVIIDKNGLHSHRYAESQHQAFCVFEFVYFSRPDSYLLGDNVHLAREKMGRQLAKEHPVKADIVIGVPDSGTSAALGFAKESKIPLEIAMIRNHYIGRTFIQPYQERRELGVKLKFNLIKKIIDGKRIIIVDDSIVRGTTSRIRVKNFREAGAKEIHLRISCPPHRFGCYYGIDFPAKESLVAYDKKISEIREYLGVDSLGYLSLEGMLKCLPGNKNQYCTACWKGNYPIRVKELNKYALERKPA